MNNLTKVSRRRFLATTGTGIFGLSTFGCYKSKPHLEDKDRPTLHRPTGMDDAAWADVRAQFILDPSIIYMNNASLGMPPAIVAEAVAAGYKAVSREPSRGKHDLSEQISQLVIPGLSRLLGTNANEIALTRNATEALHLQAVGLDLQPGDEVIFTTQEHPAGLRPWLFRADRHGIKATDIFVPSPLKSEEHLIGLFENAITPRTRAIAFCHVTRGGHLYPVKKLSEMARNHGLISLVDGAQAVGMFPIDLHDLGCDAYSASLHKWLLGPVGTGVLYISESARQHIRSAYAHDGTLDSPAFAPPGTADLPLRAGISAAISFMETIGLDNVELRTRYLSDYLKEQLSEMNGIKLLSGGTLRTSCPGSTIFEVEDVDAIKIVSTTNKMHSIHIDEHKRDGHNAIRVSTHIYNTKTEVDRLVEVLQGFI